jgi:hypothetical protein
MIGSRQGGLDYLDGTLEEDVVLHGPSRRARGGYHAAPVAWGLRAMRSHSEQRNEETIPRSGRVYGGAAWWRRKRRAVERDRPDERRGGRGRVLVQTRRAVMMLPTAKW